MNDCFVPVVDAPLDSLLAFGHDEILVKPINRKRLEEVIGDI